VVAGRFYESCPFKVCSIPVIYSCLIINAVSVALWMVYSCSITVGDESQYKYSVILVLLLKNQQRTSFRRAKFSQLCYYAFHFFQEKSVNSEEFSPSVIKGILNGFWWAYVTMTTVG
jgi:hypothetical protein